MMESGFTTNNIPTLNFSKNATQQLTPGTPEARIFATFTLLREFFRSRPTSTIISVFRDADVNGSGFLTYPEFKRAVRGLNIDAAPDDLQAIFDMFDRTGDGKIAEPDFISVLLEEPDAASQRFMQVGIGKTLLYSNPEPPELDHVEGTEASGYTNGWQRGWYPLPSEGATKEMLQSSSEIGRYVPKEVDIDSLVSETVAGYGLK
mmetsp:Transcript_3675/g.7873  ORF Transcript_3675/g.7873 Transcript_3675/m.7873 type:complete len:205 (-) Transcript_3675:291-905(-)